MITFEKIENIVNKDIFKIKWEQDVYPALFGESDGLCRGDGIIERVIREDTSDFPIRLYVISVYSEGIAILGHKNSWSNKINYTIFNLSEDDGYFFIRNDNHVNKFDFINMVSRALSLLNNISE